MKKAIIFVAILLLLGAGIFAVRESNNSKVETRNIKLELDKNSKQLNELESRKSETEQQFKESEEKRRQLEEKNKELETQVQAKAILKEKRGAVAYAAEAPKVQRAQITGDKESWLLASGIPQDQWELVDYIVSRESGWKPCAYYPSKNDCSANPKTACGLVQQYPCNKIPGDWTDPIAALKWQYQYVNSAKFDSYGGGYAGAVAYWKVHGNY